MTILLIIISGMFIVYCASESFANIARHAGSATKNFPLGLMLANQVYSINRLNGFLVAPLIGLYIDRGGCESSLKLYGLISCLGSAILLAMLLRIWPRMLGIFGCIIDSINNYGFSLLTVREVLKSGKLDNSNFKFKRKDKAILFVQGVSTSLAMPTVFFLNILALRFPQFQATLIQSATAISGIGNLLLNFYIFPRMALAETREDPDYIYYSVILGKILGMGVISPCVLILI